MMHRGMISSLDYGEVEDVICSQQMRPYKKNKVIKDNSSQQQMRTQEKYEAIEDNSSQQQMRTHEKYKAKIISLLWKVFSYNEAYAIVRAILLALSMFYWCYYSLQYGARQFTILENEQVLPGFVFSKKAVIAFSYGYSTWNSIVSAFTAIMLIYSIISKRPLFSLPLMGFFLTEILYDFCNVIMMIYVVLMNLQLQTALLYSVILLLMIVTELWMWLGVVQLFEYRMFNPAK